MLETLRAYWRWMKPKTWLFPGTIAGWRADKPITPKVVWDACQSAATRAHLEKRVSAHVWLRALARCRTAALGGHLDRCVGCDHRAISYNSCRNRHCPKCLTSARDQWLAARHDELLPVGYHHVVFTLPHELSWLALQNKQLVYGV